MDLRNIPYRSDVVTWSPDDLAEYFRTLKYKDCEKVVRKHSINGQRFLNMSENDIQKFPKLRVPIISKLSQEINRNEGRLSFLPKWAQTQKPPENPGYNEDDDGWSSFDDDDDDDDYESPDDDQEKEDEADYESPTEEVEEGEHDSDGYEPPPSNNDETHHNVIFPAKSLTNNTDYIDRPPTTRSSQQPPVPPQRPAPSPVPASFGGRVASLPAFPPPPSNNDSSRDRNIKPLKPPAPSIDRSTKPTLDRLAPPFERESPVTGHKQLFAFISSFCSCFRHLGEQLAMMSKPPVPPSDRYEREIPPPLRKQIPVNYILYFLIFVSTVAPQRPVPQLSLPPYSTNTFPSKSLKPPPKPGPCSMTGAESVRNLSSSVSLPPRLHLGNNSRSPSRGAADIRPPLPIPTRQTFHQTNRDGHEDSLSNEWYVAYVSRPEAEAALRKINKDGTFLVRDSSRKSTTHPYVLMVLYRDKVYNIQIRYQEQDHIYLLGTGLKGREDFTSVADIIDHFQRTPLLLIDGKDRGSRNQCMLKYAAGHV
ncbi:LCP2 protein, partial [Centropus bengalensis]|nr:LCP2 protein [Centropus bengalensis]